MSAPEILFSAEQIQERVRVMARLIASARLVPDIAMPVLVGGFVFAADLLRAERAPYLYRFVATETAGREEAVRALIGLIDREEQLISQGMIQAVGFRLVARLRRPEAGR